ncbi:MAG: DUF1638 domain-containing protein [bacterium]|nr:DUF1638 domain-containing protein [bacterium]MDW8105439.1 DUF1638 domain-containing protein [Armatimonadota bacterium]
MLLKLIACEVLTREVCRYVAESPHTVDLEFTPKGAHDDSHQLRALIQSRIDEAEASPRQYDAILLGYGLCGNATVNLRAHQTRLVIPRAHDCCTLFLGSRQKFQQHFADAPSTPFSATGYMERDGAYRRESSLSGTSGLYATLEEYIAQYGEENGRYIFETLHGSIQAAEGNRVVFIDTPETRHLNYLERCRLRAQQEGKELVVLEGSGRLLRKLVFGEWDEEFLIVQPGQRITGVYDWDEVLRAE